MDGIRKLIDGDLTAALSRLRQLSGAVAIEELPSVMGENALCADEGDQAQANETREISFATRERLAERVKRLSAALDRLNDGEYGVCMECTERISPARLRAVPEVQTCIRCQDRIEQFLRRDDQGEGRR